MESINNDVSFSLCFIHFINLVYTSKYDDLIGQSNCCVVSGCFDREVTIIFYRFIQSTATLQVYANVIVAEENSLVHYVV